MGACLSCFFGKRSGGGLYEPLLLENEREAVADLLTYLENRADTNFFEGDPLRALSTLAYSDNVDLQRSAALAFAEITEKEDVREVDRETMEPIMYLLQSHDVEVQRAASAALGNLAVNTENKLLIVQMGGLEPLIRQMLSPNVEVQCNAVGCITNLATHDENKSKIAKSGALVPLTRLARSKDMRVQRNATGALLNMTHSDENRQQLVNAGAIPVLVSLLNSPDTDVQYYCTTALSNIAVDAMNRKKLASSETRLVQSLIGLMDSTSLKVQCQAALALRNLASDEKYQLEIVRSRGLPPLLRLLQSSFLPLILSSVACIRNISIHPLNESPIIDAGFLSPLIQLLAYEENEEIQCHAISTLRNLAASSERNKRAIVDAGAVERVRELVLSVPISVQSEMTACVAVLALSDELKPRLLKLNICQVLLPLTNSSSVEVQGNSAAAIGNLSSKVQDYSPFVKVWEQPAGGLHGYLQRFLDSTDKTFQHIAIWTIVQFLEGRDSQLFTNIKSSNTIVSAINRLAEYGVTPDGEEPLDDDDDSDEGEIVALARKTLAMLQR
ncbi:putative VAC8-vacuolar membrane protein required for the cytoplasm-to-vacuole targeting [Gigaspora margarita]|uniref:Vacuolar protein 8 n=1 Tax=Gigaspora margarita TaxID=4874 RepID=A0A8H4AQ72_GIGMA|nr:putative VAC8-vacuolar membrane protein required for the cytoplasm-to-vacuole targeting [Gigaspora margarita]